MICYVRIHDVCVTLVCVCACMLTRQGPMFIMYVITCYAYMNCMWARPIMQVRAGPVILIGQGPYAN